MVGLFSVSLDCIAQSSLNVDQTNLKTHSQTCLPLSRIKVYITMFNLIFNLSKSQTFRSLYWHIVFSLYHWLHLHYNSCLPRYF